MKALQRNFCLKNNIFFFPRGGTKNGTKSLPILILSINIPCLTKKFELIIINHLSKVSRPKRRHIPGLILRKYLFEEGGEEESNLLFCLPAFYKTHQKEVSDVITRTGEVVG
jgi:hypothetical protein